MSSSNDHDTEFGDFVFDNDLTTFEALSRLDVTNLGNEVTTINRELEQTRSELNDVAIALDNLTVRVNTDGFRISDLEIQVQTQQSTIVQLGTNVQSALDLATQAQVTAQSAQSDAGSALILADSARTAADLALIATNATQIALGQTNTELSNVRTTANNAASAAAGAQNTANTANSTANNAASAATGAQNTANIANNSASTALGIAQRSQQYLNRWPTIASLGTPIYCYVQNSQWLTVTLVGTLGEPVMTETGYAGQIVTRTPAGATSSRSWNYIAFSAIGNFRSSEPLRLRSGNWQLRFGGSSVGPSTANVLVQDYVNTSI